MPRWVFAQFPALMSSYRDTNDEKGPGQEQGGGGRDFRGYIMGCFSAGTHTRPFVLTHHRSELI